MFNTPARLQRELALDEELIDNLPSLPGAPSFDFSSDDVYLDDTGYGTPLRDDFHRLDRASSRASHSTPPPLTNSSTSVSARSNSSTERFAASLATSRGSKGKGNNEVSFDVSKIEARHADTSDVDESAVIYDERSLSLPAFGIPVKPEVDSEPSEAMESISISSSSKKSEPRAVDSPASVIGGTRSPFGITKRRAIPRLQDDFKNASFSLSSSPSFTSTRKTSPSPPPQPASPPPLDEPSLPSLPDIDLSQDASLPTFIPPSSFAPRAVQTLAASVHNVTTLASIREESRSYEDRSLEVDDAQTPMQTKFAARSRFSTSRSSDEDKSDRDGSFAGSRSGSPKAKSPSPGGTPAESPPSRLLKNNPPRIVQQGPSDLSTEDSHTPSPHASREESEHAEDDEVDPIAHNYLTPRPRLTNIRTAYLPTATPADRHKSFLLSLAQSSKRPRFAAPTPHPQFGGRRPRASLPVAGTRAVSASPAVGGGSGVGDVSQISTTSSHDLGAFERANASFDPTADARPKFSHAKLNQYLSDLNKHLIEENEALNIRLAELQGDGADATGATPRSRSIMSASSNGANSAALMNDLVTALQEELEQTKAERDDAVARSVDLDTLRQRHEERGQDIVRLQREIENLQAEGRRKAEVHNTKFKQLSEGAENILREKEAELDEARERAQTLEVRLREGAGRESERIREAEAQADAARHAKLAAEKAQTLAERDARDLEAERDTLRIDVRRLEDRVKSLEKQALDEKRQAEHVLAETASKIEEEQRRLRVALEAQLAESQSQLAEQNVRVAALEEDLNSAEQRARNSHEQVQQTELAVREADKKMAQDAEELRVLNKKIDTLIRERDAAQSEAARAKLASPPTTTRKVSAASTIGSQYTSSSATAHSVDGGDMIPASEHERIVEDLEAQLEDAEREIGRLELATKDNASSTALSKARQLRIETLEKENGELNEKVTALRQALQPLADATNTRTPSRNNTLKGTPQSMRRFAFMEKTLRTPGAAPFTDYTMFRDTMKDGSADLSGYLAKFDNLRAELELADDKYDGAMDELGSMGLTNVRLVEMVHESRGRVSELEKEVTEMRRNEDRIRKRLRRCKCSRCTRRFDASAVVDAPEGDASISFSESIDVSMEDPARSRTALQASLEKVNNELAGMKKLWASERQSLMGEKAALRDNANRLTAELKSEAAKVELERSKAREATKRVHDEGARQKILLQGELDAAKGSVATLENELRQERAKLRSLNNERNHSTREMTDVMAKLEAKESNLEDVKSELSRLRQENRNLDEELRKNGQADHKARKLAAKMNENQTQLDQLRSERDGLTREHAELQNRFAQLSEQNDSARRQLAKFQTAHDERRHQLDIRVSEIEDLRQTIEEQAAELLTTEGERKALTAERARVAQTLGALEADLNRVRREAEKIRRDVAQLREEREKMLGRNKEDRRVTESAQAEIRKMHDIVVGLQKKLRRQEDLSANHVCAADEQTLKEMQKLHREHCKSFMRRIHYLKARVTREHGFRYDLAYQKQHLLNTITYFEQTEKNVLVIASRLGLPRPTSASASSKPSQKKKKRPLTFRTVAKAVLFLCRTKMISETWQRARVDRDAVLAGYELARGHPLRTQSAAS